MTQSPLEFLQVLGRLKTTPRTGWLRFIEKPESIADHSFRVAVLGLFAPPPLDPSKCVMIGLIHDLAESIVGDIPTYAGVPKEQKSQLESLGFHVLQELLADFPEVGKRIHDLWLEYENGSSGEGRWMKEMDKYECLVQAFEYELKTEGQQPGLSEFQGLLRKMSSVDGLQWSSILTRKRNTQTVDQPRRNGVVLVTGDHSSADGYLSRIAQEQGLAVVTISTIISLKSEDRTYAHSATLQAFAQRGIDLPPFLVASALHSTLQANESWLLVLGFPTDQDQLTEFVTQAQCQRRSIHFVPKPASIHDDGEGSRSPLPYLRAHPEWHREIPPGSGEEVVGDFLRSLPTE